MNHSKKRELFKLDRTLVIRVLIVVIGIIFSVRLFYLQIIRHSHYETKANDEHTNPLTLQADRGGIRVHDGPSSVPLVLNETKYTVFADPKLIKDVTKTAEKLAPILGDTVSNLENKLKINSRYSVLSKKRSKEDAEKIASLKLAGVRSKPQSYRTYPQNSLGAQFLGFVNDDGDGQYGVEGFLDKDLRGTSGLLKAITNNSRQNPIILAAANEDVMIAPKPGKIAQLTVDLGIQRAVEDALKTAIDTTKAPSASAIVMDPNTGAIKAMANYPTYNPSEYQQQKDSSLFINNIVSGQYEMGSVVKPFVMTTALEEGLVSATGTFPDPGPVVIDGKKVSNALNYGAATRNVWEILQKSLNTGSIYLLQQMGGGEINDRARQTLYDYYTNHFRLGKKTGVEQVGEAEGIIEKPTGGFGLNIRYANMTFGQGMTLTMAQVIGGFSSIINGGIYYQPHLLEGWIDEEGKLTPAEHKVVGSNVVSDKTSSEMKTMLQKVIEVNFPKMGRTGFIIGGKTGTAEIADGKGGYREDINLGTFLGYVGGSKPELVVMIRMDAPKINGFAGPTAAAPVFKTISDYLLSTQSIDPVQ